MYSRKFLFFHNKCGMICRTLSAFTSQRKQEHGRLYLDYFIYASRLGHESNRQSTKCNAEYRSVLVDSEEQIMWSKSVTQPNQTRLLPTRHQTGRDYTGGETIFTSQQRRWFSLFSLRSPMIFLFHRQSNRYRYLFGLSLH